MFSVKQFPTGAGRFCRLTQLIWLILPFMTTEQTVQNSTPVIDILRF
jgi:hypothetical protein